MGYRFSPTSELVRLEGGNENVTQRRLRRLREQELSILSLFPQMIEEVRSHREQGYAEAALRGQYMQLGFL